MNNNFYQSISSLLRGYEDGSITPSSVLDRCLSRISSLEDRLGAFEVVYEEEARKAADAVTRAFESGHRIGPFHGIPFALKDIVDLEGRITTGGSKVLKDRVSPTTATIAKRLIAAGGILVGKTKTVEVAMGGWGYQSAYGYTMESVGPQKSSYSRWFFKRVRGRCCFWYGELCGGHGYWWISSRPSSLVRNHGSQDNRRPDSHRWNHAIVTYAGYGGTDGA